MSKSKLTTEDFCRAAKRLRCEVAAIKAVAQVESRGEPFYSDGFPVILFERHKFREFTKGKFNASHPRISGPAGGYGPAGQNQQNKFNEAFALNPTAAMKSCSYGAFQIMGFNHAVCGYATVGEFVDAMKESVGKQLDAFVNFVINNGLGDELRNLNWAGFAKGYNGSGYRKNQYDTKMATAYAKFARENIDCNTSAAVSSAERGSVGIAAFTVQQPQPTELEPPPSIGIPVPVSVISEPIEVEKVVAEPESKIDTTITKWSSRFVAIPAAALTGLGAVGSWLTSTPEGITVTLIIAGSVIAVIYFLVRMITSSRDKARADKLQAERETRAHEIQLALLTSASDKDKNTVKIVSPPTVVMENSDHPSNAAAPPQG